jgi:hypothetical protein
MRSAVVLLVTRHSYTAAARFYALSMMHEDPWVVRVIGVWSDGSEQELHKIVAKRQRVTGVSLITLKGKRMKRELSIEWRER